MIDATSAAVRTPTHVRASGSEPWLKTRLPAGTPVPHRSPQELRQLFVGHRPVSSEGDEVVEGVGDGPERLLEEVDEGRERHRACAVGRRGRGSAASACRARRPPARRSRGPPPPRGAAPPSRARSAFPSPSPRAYVAAPGAVGPIEETMPMDLPLVKDSVSRSAPDRLHIASATDPVSSHTFVVQKLDLPVMLCDGRLPGLTSRTREGREGAAMNDLFGLGGKVAVVIGGTGELCGAMAEGFAAAGAEVVLVGRDAGKASARLERIGAAGGRGSFVSCDVTSKAALEALLAEVLARSGRVDVLVNGAGINSAAPLPRDSRGGARPDLRREHEGGLPRLSGLRRVLRRGAPERTAPERASSTSARCRA